MRRKLLLVAVLVLCGTWLSACVVAQGQSMPPGGGGSLVDRLDEFGRKLIDGVFPQPRSTQVQPPGHHPLAPGS